MILVRSPLRITLGGGSTDLPSYADKYGGFSITAAIDRYVYVSVINPFFPGIFVKYSQLEHVASIEYIRHPIIRETLRLVGPGVTQLEITTLADIPGRTGLGSSSSFTTGLLMAFAAFHHRIESPYELARLATEIEMRRLAQPIGPQDAYSAAYGGLLALTFQRDGTSVTALHLSAERQHDLEDRLLLFFTGITRAAATQLAEQQQKIQEHDAAILENLHMVKALGLLTRRELEDGDLDALGELLTEQWRLKQQRGTQMTSLAIQQWHALGLANGALGGKLVGAGGGGFLLFYATDARRLRTAMRGVGLQEVRFRFDFEGTKVLVS